MPDCVAVDFVHQPSSVLGIDIARGINSTSYVRWANPWLIAVVNIRALYTPSTLGPPKAVQEASFGMASFVPRNCQLLKSGGSGKFWPPMTGATVARFVKAPAWLGEQKRAQSAIAEVIAVPNIMVKRQYCEMECST
ncbi:hypothetical protein KC323_g262 [Hortaea werneckii]|nr:hypothetical protein KC323_g262 [Hortaea werneckii]KAI7360156.1 hypothetical protein KC320_g207 [Hortaea werneckii]